MDDKLETLLAELITAQENLSRAFALRDNAHNAIMAEFAALRQQRDALAEILEATASCGPCLRSACHIDNPLCGQMLARAALASVEEAGD